MTQDDQQHGHSGIFSGMHSHDGGALHWHDEFGEHMAEGLSDEERAVRALDWKMHNVQLVTVGVDIGSSTSHLMFSKVFMQLLGEGRDVHSVVVGREILWQSPIILTPYLDDGAIDAVALKAFVDQSYAEVGATANEIDTGAIILTGEALKRKNSRAIGEMFAKDTGKFVHASAGHHLEAVLAANGSGTVARSRRDGRTLLNVDIGGGTTKFALVQDGQILGTAAIAIGARLIVRDENGRITRLDEPARRTAEYLGIELAVGDVLTAGDETRIVQAWTDAIAGMIAGHPPEGLTAGLMLTDPLPAKCPAQALTFSGGVSEFIFQRESSDFGDLGRPLARSIRAALSGGDFKLPAIIDPNLGIRATAIGASLFTTQVGINLYVSDESLLPLLNLPVLLPRIELDGSLTAERMAAAIGAALVRADLGEGEQPIALALRWPEEDDLVPSRVRALAEGIRDALPVTIERGVPFVLAVDQTIGLKLGEVLRDDLKLAGNYLSIEGVTLSEFDFIDVAEVIRPAEVVPVTVKSLLFAGGLDRRSVKQALIEAARSMTHKNARNAGE